MNPQFYATRELERSIEPVSTREISDMGSKSMNKISLTSNILQTRKSKNKDGLNLLKSFDMK